MTVPTPGTGSMLDEGVVVGRRGKVWHGDKLVRVLVLKVGLVSEPVRVLGVLVGLSVREYGVWRGGTLEAWLRMEGIGGELGLELGEFGGPT